MIAELLVDGAEVAEHARDPGMIGTERLLVDRQCPLVRRDRLRIVAEVVARDAEDVVRRRELGMIVADRLLEDRNRALGRGGGLRVLAECLVSKREVAERLPD